MRLRKLLRTRACFFVERKLGDPLMWCWRFGISINDRRHYLVDITQTRFRTGKPPYTRLRLWRLTVLERNRKYSGLPQR